MSISAASDRRSDKKSLTPLVTCMSRTTTLTATACEEVSDFVTLFPVYLLFDLAYLPRPVHMSWPYSQSPSQSQSIAHVQYHALHVSPPVDPFDTAHPQTTSTLFNFSEQTMLVYGLL